MYHVSEGVTLKIAKVARKNLSEVFPKPFGHVLADIVQEYLETNEMSGRDLARQSGGYLPDYRIYNILRRGTATPGVQEVVCFALAMRREPGDLLREMCERARNV